MALPKTIMAFIAFISFLVSTTFAVDVFSTTNVVTYWVNYDLLPRIPNLTKYICIYRARATTKNVSRTIVNRLNMI